MKQKETNTKRFNLKRKPWAFLIIAVVFALFSIFANFIPNSAKAQQATLIVKPEDIAFELSVSDNFFRTNNGGTVSLSATLKLVKPDLLTLGYDNSQANCLAVDASSCTAKRIIGIDVGLINTGQNATACSNTTQGTFNCKFPVTATHQTPATIKKGDTFTFSINLSAADLKNLAVTSDDTGKLNEILVYPFLELNNSNSTFSNGGKSVYIQSYNTVDQLNANKTSPRPTGVPENGAVTGNPSLKDTGNPLLGFINQLINALVGLLQELIYLIFYYLIAPVIQAMLNIRTYTDVFAAVIYPGWEVVRNVCNILFIVALIAIGLGTLFRVESYQYKHLLVDLIIAALLVNFSLVIAQAVLGVADTVQSQFLPNNVEVIRSLARDLMAGWKTMNWSNISSSGYFSNTVQPLFALALSLGSFVVFSALAGFLFIRIVMLWVLLMLSPLAYAMRVLPTTKSYAAKWWGEFLKYAFFTPIIAFFLNMAAVINNQYNAAFNSNGSVLQKLVDDPSLVGNSTISAFVFRVGSNVIILVFLVIAIKAAEQAGVFGADVVAKAAQGGLMAPFKGAAWLGQKGAGRFGRWYNEKTAHLVEQHGDHPVSWAKKAAFAALNPKAFVKGWSERSHELEHHAQEEAAAAGRMVAEQYLTSGTKGLLTAGFLGKPQLIIPYNQFTARKHENDYLKDYENMKKETLMAAALAVENMGGAEGAMRRRSIIKAALKNGFQDDILRMTHFAKKYADEDGVINSAETINRFLSGYLADSDGHLGEQALRFMGEDLEELGKSTGHYEYLGHAFFDNNSGTWKRGMQEYGDLVDTGRKDNTGNDIKIRRLKNTWQVGYSTGEGKKISGRMRAGMAPHNTEVLAVDPDLLKTIDENKVKELTEEVRFGRPDGELDDYQRAVLTTMWDGATIQQGSFAQARHKEWTLSNNIDKSTGVAFIKDERDFQRIKKKYDVAPNFVKEMYRQLMDLPLNSASGVKMAILKDDGTIDYRILGNTDSTPTPVISSVNGAILKNPRLGLRDNEKKDLIDGQLLDSQIKDVYMGNSGPADVTAKITSEGKSSAAKAAQISTEIFKSVETELTEKYQPLDIIERINSTNSYNLSPVEIGALNSKISGVAGTAFRDAWTAGRAVNSNDYKKAVEDAIQKAIDEENSRPKPNKDSIAKYNNMKTHSDLFAGHILNMR